MAHRIPSFGEYYGGIVRQRKEAMTLRIMDAANSAETWPGSRALNWGEVPLWALVEWASMHPQQQTARTDAFDIESVKRMFEQWWVDASAS